MADDWRTRAQIIFQAGDSVLDVFNGTGSGRIMRIRRVLLFNHNAAGTVGTLTNLQLWRTTDLASGTGYIIDPVPHLSNQTALPAEVTTGTSRALTDSDLFRQILWSQDETIAGASQGIDDYEQRLPFSVVWDAGYGDSTTQAVVCREAEGFHIRNVAALTGFIEAEIEFTNEAS